MSRFNCKVVEAVPIQIDVYEIETNGILHYMIRNRLRYALISPDIVAKYLEMYAYIEDSNYKKKMFKHLKKRNLNG